MSDREGSRGGFHLAFLTLDGNLAGLAVRKGLRAGLLL